MSQVSQVREIGVGLLGLGNVGSGVVQLLADNAAAIEERLGARVVVRRIAVREAKKRRKVAVDRRLLTTDARAVIDGPDVAIVVELVGGEAAAKQYVLHAIERGRHVVTANKALLATHGPELFAAAAKRGVELYLEAAVCGGVPVLRALREGLASDKIEALHGIVNGTSNFILSTMTAEGRPFDEVLAAAQREGYAEADPALDVDGGDAAHKLVVLAMLAFGARVRLADVYVEGIRQITPVDHAYAERFGMVVKPLVIARDHGPEGLELRVHPTMIPKRWLLASVAGVNNAVYVTSRALGHSMYYGRGAGMMPTAVAVVSDVLELARNVLGRSPGMAATSVPRLTRRAVRDIGLLRSRYYLRFAVLDRPGVLAQLAGVLGKHEVSIAHVTQEGKEPERAVTVVILTHEARERNVRLALAQIAKLESVVEAPRLVRLCE